MINGDPADSNAALFKEGAHNGFDATGVEIAKEYDTPEWSATNAQNEMQQAITALGKSGFAGVYAANDDTGGGAIAAMKSAGVDPEERPTTGQDATVSGVQRILVGQQYMTVYKATDKETKVAAEIAVALAKGEEFPKSKITDEPNNGKVKVPSVLLEPVAVTKDNIKQTVVADGFIAAEELCTGPYVKACEEAGIS
jgi:D-xylose transport system substrate-binding protein